MIAFLTSERSRDLGLLLIRLILGFTMAYHGWGKISSEAGVSGFATGLGNMGFPLPTLNAWAATLAELVGGILVATGTFFRPAALSVAITMFVAAFVVHAENGFSMANNGLEYPLNLGLVALGLALIGSGKLALKTKFDC